MKKILLLSIFAIILLAVPVVSAQEFCSAPGGGCPSTCLSAGSTCYPKSQSVAAPNVPGKELTCIKQTNVGCGFFLEFPPIKGNECPSGMVHDDVIDGATDCGFLGLGVLLGDSKSICHQNVDVSCKVNAKCPAGTKPKAISEKSCFVSTGQATSQTLQCCNVQSPTTTTPVIEAQTPQDVLDERDNFANTVLIVDEAQHVILAPGQEYTFTFFAKTKSGEIVTNRTTVEWSLVDTDNYANSVIDENTGTLVVGSQAHGNFRVKLTQVGGFEKTDFADVTVVNFHDLSVEPATLQAEVGARVLFRAKALEAITNSPIDVPATWSVQGPAIVSNPNEGISQTYSVILINAGNNANITARAGQFNATSRVGITAFSQDRTPSQIQLDAGNSDMTVGSQRTLGVLILSADGIALASSRASFTSNNSNVVNVTDLRRNPNAAPGVLTAVSAGDAKITVTAGAQGAQVMQSIDVHVVECQEGQTDTAYCAARNNFDVTGPLERVCVSGKWSNTCDPQSCTEESRFACIRNGRVGVFNCNLDTGHFNTTTCNEVSLGSANAEGAGSQFNGAICASTTKPTLELLAGLAANPQSADLNTCLLVGIYSNAPTCIEKDAGKSVTLTYDFGSEGSSSNSFTVGDWAYSISDASTGDVSMVSFTLSNLVSGEVIPSSFVQSGADLPELNSKVHVESITVTKDADDTIHASVVVNVEYNKCTYAADFSQTPKAQ